MSNQASEDVKLLREAVADIIDEAIDQHTESPLCGERSSYAGNEPYDQTDKILSLIRTEKLKLLAEVRERVVGENDSQPGNPAPDLVEHNRLVRDGLRFEQRIALTKLEAEL